MDFAIDISTGQADMTFNKADGYLANNVFLSLKVRRGTFFARPDFGSRLYLLRKNTQRAEDLAEDYATEALQWILDAGRAKSIDVVARRDREVDLHRMKLLISVVKPDGQQISFEYFAEVV